jgi:hypothetical protein
MREARLEANLNNNSKARKRKVRRRTIQNLHGSPPTLKLGKQRRRR